MPSKDEVFQIWAPIDGVWSPWVKPVLFSFVDAVFNMSPARSISLQHSWVPQPASTAIVVDLPGEIGVTWSGRLAELGYRPVPLYNALPFAVGERLTPPSSRPATTVHVEEILVALVREAPALDKMHLPSSAPPVFLLDADRRLARTDVRPGIFDNRSVCFTTDFPSAAFLIGQGIDTIVVIQEAEKFAPDLVPVLVAWQTGGIRILRKLYRDAEIPAAVVVNKYSFLSWIWLRLRVALGFHRGELGAFGEIVPASSG